MAVSKPSLVSLACAVLIGCSGDSRLSASAQALSDSDGPHVPPPTGVPSPVLISHGGRVLSRPVLFTIYFGDYWQSSELSAQLWINSFAQEFGTSAMADVVAQYGVGNSTFGGSAIISGSLTATVSDDAVKGAVREAISSGALPLKHQGIYLVFLPPGKRASAGGGYHQRFNDSTLSDQPIVYGALATYLGDQGLDLATQGASHEFTEAETDPFLDGWYTDDGYEIADLVSQLGASPAAAQDRSGYMVQLMWSNEDKLFEISPASTRRNDTNQAPADQCTAGAKQCIDGDRYQDCGDFDGGGATEWSSPYSCSASWPGTVCSDGWCVGPPPPSDQCSAGSKQCVDGDRYQDCGDFDGDGATEWSSPSSCSASWPGTVCSDGWCVGPPPPSDQCSAGSKQCVDGDQYQDCGDFDGDGATEWSSPYSCSASWPGTVCSDGWCVPGDSGCGDTSSDPNNCGSCGNNCYDQGFSGCDSGQCF